MHGASDRVKPMILWLLSWSYVKQSCKQINERNDITSIIPTNHIVDVLLWDIDVVDWLPFCDWQTVLAGLLTVKNYVP